MVGILINNQKEGRKKMFLFNNVYEAFIVSVLNGIRHMVKDHSERDRERERERERERTTLD